MSSNTFKFNINPEPRQTDINLTEGNYVEIAFTVQNKSRHDKPQRVEILIEGLEGPPSLDDPDGPGLAPRFWQSWLSLEEKTHPANAEANINKTEWIFAPEGIRVFTVRIQLPEQLRSGTYTFRLVVLGVDDPDHKLATSEPVSFTVKSVDLDIRRYVIVGLLLLALVIVAAISLAILIEPEPRLNVSLSPPESGIMVGKIMTYTVTIQNAREMTATQVLLDYHQPPNIIASTAFVPNSTYRHCDELDKENIQCQIGDLGPLQSVSVLIQAVPGPGASIITHTNAVTISSRLEDNRTTTPAEVLIESSPVEPASGLSLVIDPDIGTPTVEEPVTYRLLAWNNITRTETMTVTYMLPKGMRFQRIGEEREIVLPPACQQWEDDYFSLDCQIGPLAFVEGQPEIAELNISAVPNEISTELLHAATATVAGLDVDVVETIYATTIVNSALIFDGVDDYAELGLARALETFTVEFWVHPFNNNDGQNFIGVHRDSLDNLNLFLVGYYSGNLNITIGEDFHSVAVPKLTERYHVAVSVEKLSESQSRVLVYVNGQPQHWIEPESVAVCDFCKIFNAALDTNATLPWVLGQDWDPIGQTIRPSDFFQGTMSDVTIWQELRSQEDILRSMRQRPRGDETGLVVFAPLLPITPNAPVLHDYVTDNGSLFGPRWGESVSRFGSSLVFDGNTDLLNVPGLRLSDFSLTPEDEVQVTMAGWVYVDNIPSQEQWLIGFASASGSTATLPLSSGTVDLPGGALETTINTVTNAETTESNLATAQRELLNAIAVQEALGVDVSQARIILQEARNTLYLTLAPFSQSAELTATFAPVNNIITNQVPAAFIQNLDALQSVAGIREPVAVAQAAKLVYETIRTADVPAQAIPPNAEPVRNRFQLVQAELAYAQSLVNLWQIVASNNITDTVALSTTTLDVNLANTATDQLANVARNLSLLSPADQVLLRLAALELAEQEQLAASYFALTVGEETVDSPPFTEIAVNDRQAIENIRAAQASFAEAVAIVQPWLETQLDEDVRFLLYPNLATSVQNDQLRQRLLQESGLRGYWDFNAGGGNVVTDVSGNGLTGSLQNGAAFISTVPPTLDEIFNPFSLNFEGTNDRVEIPPADQLDITTGSFSAWFKADPDVSGFRAILADEANVGGQVLWSYRLLIAQDTGLLLFDFTTNNGSQFIVTSNVPVNDSLWHHVGVTRDDQTKLVTLYLDGILQNSLAYTGQLDLTNNPLWIGQSPVNGGAHSFIGAIDDVRLYDRVLSTDEITILAGGDVPFRIDEQLTLRKLLALRGLEELALAQDTLLAAQEAELNIASAQASVTLADAEAARVATLAESATTALNERQALVAAVEVAQNNVRLLSGADANAGTGNPDNLQSSQPGQPPPVTLEEATAQLAAAEAALVQAQQLQLQSLSSAIASLQVREETLQDLDSRLDLAVNNAIEAGLQAAQKNNVELLIGPFLDWILGTQTPRRTTQEVVQEAALLAAQQALKTEVDFNVDAAQATLDAAVAERDRLIASGSNGRLRQDIINNINAYIESLNADVNAAKQSLNEALAAQQGRQTEPDIPLVLADALAQEVAQRVATQIALRVRPNYRQLVTPNPAVAEQVRLQIQNELSTALRSTRNPVRWQLYIDTYFVINQLNQDLASGTIDNEVERQLTTELRDRLVALNLAILRVLDAENAIIQPQFGFEALLNQVAAERDRAKNESELIDALTEALNQSNRALDAYIAYRNAASQQHPKALVFTKLESSLTSDTLKINQLTQLTIRDFPAPPAQDEPTGDDVPVDNPGTSPAEDGALLEGVTDDSVPPDAATEEEPAAVVQIPTPPATPPNIWIGLIIDDDGHVAVVARPRSATSWTVVKDEQPIVIGQWVHYTAVVSYNAGTGTVDTVQLLRNGDEVKGFDLAQNPITIQVDAVNCAPNFYIGGLCASNLAFAFAGRLDEIRIWNRIMSEEEIDGWRDLPGEFYDEYAYWAFDDGPGRTNAARCPFAFTCDQSSHGFHVRVAGPAWLPADFGLETQGNGRS